MLKCMLQGARRVSQEKGSTPLDHSALFLYCVCDRRQTEYHRNALSNHRGETHFHDCTEMGLEAIERLCFLAFLPPPGTSKREARKRNLSIALLPTPLQGWMTV